MPYIGLLPFLQNTINISFLEAECVNALHRASPISTAAAKLFYASHLNRVNALHRASPISTVPFKKPYKINGFRDRFQGVIVRKF